MTLPNAQRYSEWLNHHPAFRLPIPNPEGYFVVGQARYVLPYLRVWYHAEPEDDVPPIWQRATWNQFAGGWVRYLRADQFLDWATTELKARGQKRPSAQIRKWFRKVPLWSTVDHPVFLKPEIVARYVDAVRVRTEDGGMLWRRGHYCPKEMRDWELGLDPVHTPEGPRVGLRRVLAAGWEIDDLGKLSSASAANTWDTVNILNEYRLHVGPRRLMLGAGLSAKAVPIGGEQVKAEPVEGPGPGATYATPMVVGLATLGGWTHEDAIVVSDEAAGRLSRHEVVEFRIRVPALAGRVELAELGDMPRGGRLVRAWVDEYALGLLPGEAGVDQCGWRELQLPGAELTGAGKLLSIALEREDGIQWRGTAVARMQVWRPLAIGDKLGTPHGLKGGVSAIRSAESMPRVGGEAASVAMGPMGIESRAALGELLEMGVTEPKAQAINGGRAQVMRMPNEAASSLRVVGGAKKGERGMRFGEMEFWALMAHNAPAIANELLSAARCTSSWLDHELACGLDGYDSQAASTSAANRFLSVFGLAIGDATRWPQLVAGRIEMSAEPPPTKSISRRKLTYQLLCSASEFTPCGLLSVALDPPISFAIPMGRRGNALSLRLTQLNVLPPWLRPDSIAKLHPITTCYLEVGHALARNNWISVEKGIQQLVDVVLHKDKGLAGFVRNQILSRRLTRTARAVTVPDPQLRIDEVGVPATILERMFEGLESRPQRVLLMRPPTLHRYGLLAMRPVPQYDEAPVIRIPLGVLKATGADFDGDHVTLVAISDARALAEAERLVPGAEDLRQDRYRPEHRAVFRFSRELACPEEEDALASKDVTNQEVWAGEHAALQARRLTEESARGLEALAAIIAKGGLTANKPPEELTDDELLGALWVGMPESAWLLRATDEMRRVVAAELRKGHYGGVLRRQIYRLKCTDDSTAFTHSIRALHALTERLTQSALSVKKGSGPAMFDPKRFFAGPAANANELLNLDKTFDTGLLVGDLGQMTTPSRFLTWLGGPTRPRLLAALAAAQTRATACQPPAGDPRIAWFFR